MPENPPLPVAPPPEGSDAPFKRMITLSTAASLGLAYGWLGGFVRQPDGNLAFHWRWLVLFWVLIGLCSTAWFWRKIWPPAGRPDATRKDIIQGSLALALPGVWWLLFPLRSQSGTGQHFWQVLLGLSIAAMVLTFGAFMVIRLGRAFEEEDEGEGK